MGRTWAGTNYPADKSEALLERERRGDKADVGLKSEFGVSSEESGYRTDDRSGGPGHLSDDRPAGPSCTLSRPWPDTDQDTGKCHKTSVVKRHGRAKGECMVIKSARALASIDVYKRLNTPSYFCKGD